MTLPYEVLVYLFKYLQKSDRKAASETCRGWYEAANDRIFLQDKVVVIYKIDLNDDTTSLQIFEKSLINYDNYFFCGVEISNKLNGFWEKVGENIRFLTLRNCDIHEKTFVQILQKCKNLEVLNIHGCKELFMSGCLLEGKTDGLIVNSLQYLKCLSLSDNQYLTDALFKRFVMTTRVLEDLNLSACSVQFHFGLVKKFYPRNCNIFKNPSESVCTFYFVSQVIKSRAKNIKRLQFSNTLIDGNALQALSEIEGLDLEYLYLNSCDQLTNSSFLELTISQSSLKELDIGLCARVTDQSLIFICDNLSNLEYLNIQRCRAVTDLGIAELHKLTKLKRLNISQCEHITKHGIKKGICKENNIEELDINSLNLDQSGLIMISEMLPELRFLNISYCFNAVTDSSIQVIFKNQVLLHTLKMSYCDKVSDAGLTGMGKVETGGDDNGPIMSCYDAKTQNKIYLGSRAEEEIVKDARRKEDVMRMCENLSMESYTGYSLARIKELRVLDISGCNRTTNVSLTYAFCFKELISIDLSRCQQITSEGISHLVHNCPGIEYINFNNCYNLNDDAVRELVMGLSRLQQLELRGCNQLTDKTLEAIKLYCKKLKVLDIQGCRNISAELASTIWTLPTVHTLLMSKSGPYPNDGVKEKSSPSGFLPVLMSKLNLH